MSQGEFSASKIRNTSSVGVYPQFNQKNGCVHIIIIDLLEIVMKLTFTERLYGRQYLQCFTGINSPMSKYYYSPPFKKEETVS